MIVKPLAILRKVIGPLILVGIVLGIVGHLQAISDWVRLYNYTPPPIVSDLATQTTMTPLARNYFYINHPEIDDREAFNNYCASQGEQTIVLGCYHPKDSGIFVFAVQDIRLEGVEQVTAAHEMLHAAYDRLSDGQREKVDQQLQDFYNNHLQDKRVRDTMAAYQKSEPKDVVNEMHSIFGTEVDTLTPGLEQYYKQYFTARSKVTAYADAYQSEFSGRTAKVAAYDKQLSALKAGIDEHTADLKTRLNAIDTARQQMEAERSANNIPGYNAEVPVYNSQVDSYNALVKTTKDEITQYNQTVNLRNSLALEVRQLTQSISSQPQLIGQ